MAVLTLEVPDEVMVRWQNEAADHALSLNEWAMARMDGQNRSSTTTHNGNGSGVANLAEPRQEELDLDAEKTRREHAEIDKITEMLRNLPMGKTRSIMEFAGVGAHNRIGMDAQEYVNQLREEWD